MGDKLWKMLKFINNNRNTNYNYSEISFHTQQIGNRKEAVTNCDSCHSVLVEWEVRQTTS